MEIVRGLHNLRPRHRGCVVTIGNFDGLHRGHQAMIERLRSYAQQYGLPAAMLTFEPSPREFFDPENAPARLTPFREKMLLLKRAGIDRCVMLQFNAALRQLRGDQFIEILTRRLGVRAVVVGHDFKFAYRGEADAGVLSAAGAAQGFTVDVIPPVAVDGERVSSTAVRAALAEGDLEHADRLLGRRFAICGRVVPGEQLGRKIGFATANLRIHRHSAPLDGVFAVRVRGAAPRVLSGVASIGTRPTVGGVEPLLEVHLFDFDGDLYGRYLEVEFSARLREERKFANLEQMVVQIHEDARQARELLRVLE